MASRSLGTKTSICVESAEDLAGPHAAGVPTHAAVDRRALSRSRATQSGRSRCMLTWVAPHAGSVDRPLERVGLLLVGDELALVHAGQRDRDRALEAGRAAQPSEIEIGLGRQHADHVQPSGSSPSWDNNAVRAPSRDAATARFATPPGVSLNASA